jgi:hypothetical protein
MAALLAIFALVPSWLYKWIGVALLIFVAYFYVDHKATVREHAKCEAAAKEAVRQADLQDGKAAREALAAEQSTTQTLRDQQANDNAELAELRRRTQEAGSQPQRKDAAGKPVVAPRGCVLNQPDIDGLRE